MSVKFDEEKTEAYHWRMNTEARIKQLETDDLTHKVDLTYLKANCATKADIAKLEGEFGKFQAEMKAQLAEAKASIIQWSVTAIFIAQLLPALLKIFLPG
ncbi:hypothetical protein GTP45_05280 [Pseudoduganella sp. FT55W]|uniref:DUF1640 domain-containing protein n=1 Tax=Duganella rivi TaxID=2666083 RepID=A0A7X4KAT1_9BURK|nr:hypothetical protein [Duganella rivi]MYM66247.1 hypothetical protein [Duganella rivi]